MTPISQFFNVKDATNRTFRLLPLFLSVILLYHGTVLSLFISLHPVTTYVVVFLLFSLAIFYKNYPINLNKWLIISLFFIVFPLLMGVNNNWAAKDIAADLARYLGPFIGFSAGLVLLRRIKFEDLLRFLYFLGFVHLCLFYISVFVKFMHVVDGYPLLEYAKYALEVEFLYFFLFYFSFKRKIFNKFTYLLIGGYIFGFLVCPILVMSKAKLITTFLSVILIFLFYSNIRAKVIIVILGFSLISLTFAYTDSERALAKGRALTADYTSTLSRFTKAYETVVNDDYHTDASTSYRLAEIKNITGTLMESPLTNLPFGLGLGALYYDTYSPIKGGVHQANYRPDGGIHHVFTVYFAYILRYGLAGLFILLSWIIASYSKISTCGNKDPIVNNITSSVKLYIIVSLVADIFVPVHVYGNFSFGFFVALGIIVASKNQFNYYDLKSKVIS